MQFWSPQQLESEMAEHSEGVQLGPGATLERRQVLHLSGMAALWLMLPTSVRANRLQQASATERETLHQIMAEVHQAASLLITEESPDEEAYVKLLSTLMRRMPRQPREPFYGWYEQDSGWATDTTYFSAPVVLFQIKMEPGGTIKLHDHRHYNGVLMGISGEVEVANYNVVREQDERLILGNIAEAAQEQEFLIQQKTKSVIRPGELSTLTRDRDNIHEVRGGTKGGILLDLFTYFSPQARSFELDVVDDLKESNLKRVTWSRT